MSLLYRLESEEVLAIARLSQSRDGATLMNVLKAELQVTQERLIDATEDATLRKLQGRANLCKGLISVLAEGRKKDAPL